jgi:hypothetical protein
MIAKVLVSASMALIAVGLAAPASATVQDFFGGVQAAGITGPGPAVLANGWNVCWELWNGGYTGGQAAAALQKNYPTLTSDQAARFVVDAYQDLCPVPGAYDWWAYGTGGAGGGAGAAGG